ncbi:MAG: DNA cytosine methyltransferase [Pseudomonadota bacterium]
MAYYEFFCGGGMARIGLGPMWECAFANELDPKKCASYRSNFQNAAELREGDIASLISADLPGQADMAWASFPCQDLSLAGNGTGLRGKRSGLFWTFMGLMEQLSNEGRPCRSIVLENVCGTITSHRGRDLAAICEELTRQGYIYAPLVIDAHHFVPQSRPRLFIVAYKNGVAAPPRELAGAGPHDVWHPDSFGLAYDMISAAARDGWRWLHLPVPARRNRDLIDIVENHPSHVRWHNAFETNKLLRMMSPINLEKVEQQRESREIAAGTVFKRTRVEKGERRQRAEVRFDGLAGCLRTPAGGSSRQILLLVQGNRTESRLVSPRETARLMGLPDDYVLPDRVNDALKLTGDGVAPPVVSWLARHALDHILADGAEEVAA